MIDSSKSSSIKHFLALQPSSDGVFLYVGVLTDVTTHFIADARALNKVGGNHVKVHIINPSGTKTDTYITDKGDGTYRVEYTAFEDGKGKTVVLFLLKTCCR